MRNVWLLPVLLVGGLSCGDDDGPASSTYRASIVRTSLGIPHVTADDWGGLGFGAAYAYAEDNFCVLMREVVVANGRSARYFGDQGNNVANDTVYTYLNTDAATQGFLDVVSPELQDLVRGYAAGFSHYLEVAGASGLPGGETGCRDAEWVRPITELDLGKVYRKLVLFGSTGALTPVIAAARAPDASMARAEPIASTPFRDELLAPIAPNAIGSNAYAIGGELSRSGHGILLGNPHFPWQGPLRWYVQHLTIPGQLDVMGAALQGVPLVNVGFNQNVAWSHTVSTGQRFTFYELHLTEDDPMAYHYDDEVRRIEPHAVMIEVRGEDGTVSPRTETIYTSHYGFIVDLGAINDLVGGWPALGNVVFSFRDANIDNPRVFEQFLGFNRARSVDDFEQTLRGIGLPWVNTLAVDRDGNALYADVTAVPHVTAEQLEDCSDSLLTDAITAFGRATLNGSRSECEWGRDDDGPPGLLGYANLPRFRTREYAGNANDSYWLSNADNLLTGFSPLIGKEGVEQSIRTRLAFVQLEERIAGTDELDDAPGFTVELVQEMLMRHRDHSAELALDDVVAICEAVTDWTAGDCGEGGVPYSENGADAAEICGVLAAWDRRYELDSRGAAPWREVWARIQGTDGLWAVPFDATDPVHTPRDLDEENATVVEAVRCALGNVYDGATRFGIALDTPWGELQFKKVGSERIPIPGGLGQNAFSVITSNFVEDDAGYSDIVHGNSYVQTVTFDDTDCPVAYAFLTYAQSTNPESAHHADWTRRYSDEQWHRMPFCAADIEADRISSIDVTNAR